MAKRITIGSRAVAVAIVAEALDQACQTAGVGESDLYAFSNQVADALVSMAWDVEYKPTAERLILTIDAGITGPDRSRQTPEDRNEDRSVPPPTVGGGGTDIR